MEFIDYKLSYWSCILIFFGIIVVFRLMASAAAATVTLAAVCLVGVVVVGAPVLVSAVASAVGASGLVSAVASAVASAGVALHVGAAVGAVPWYVGASPSSSALTDFIILSMFLVAFYV